MDVFVIFVLLLFNPLNPEASDLNCTDYITATDYPMSRFVPLSSMYCALTYPVSRVSFSSFEFLSHATKVGHTPSLNFVMPC